MCLYCKQTKKCFMGDQNCHLLFTREKKQDKVGHFQWKSHCVFKSLFSALSAMTCRVAVEKSNGSIKHFCPQGRLEICFQKWIRHGRFT